MIGYQYRLLINEKISTHMEYSQLMKTASDNQEFKINLLVVELITLFRTHRIGFCLDQQTLLTKILKLRSLDLLTLVGS
jgi:hypothetical protein